MKRFISFTLAILLLTPVLAGCKQTGNRADIGSDNKISVVATIFAPYDFVREIAGDNADITMLLPPASESHSFEPTPQDVIKIQNCDVFIHVGGESDKWVGEILSPMDTGKMKIVTLMDCVDVVEEEIVEGMEEEDEHDHEDEGGNHEDEPEYDEHVWTSPKNAKLIVQRISDALCEADQANADLYKQNTSDYLGKLDELDTTFGMIVEAAARKTIVFGDRFPFRYFADTYGLDYFAAFPGCSTETEPSAATIAFLIDKVTEENIPVIFHAELSNGKMAGTISEATGAKVLLLHACHNISKDDFQNGVSYLELMTRNVDALKEAIQ